jgi:hypothetical protein
VNLSPGATILLRIHRQVNHAIWDFHSLHKTFFGDVETYVWPDDAELVYFDA